MAKLLENYIEGIMLKNAELHEQARKMQDEHRVRSTVVARMMREIIHGRIVEMDIDESVMDLVNGQLSGSIEQIGQLPPQILMPSLPAAPLLLDFGRCRRILSEMRGVYPPLAGMAFLFPGDREVMRETRTRLPGKYHAAIDEVIGRAQETWTLSALDGLGNEVLVYHYRPDEQGHWSWSMYPGHQCPLKACRYSLQGGLLRTCDRCEAVKAMIVMQFGLLLLYDAGYYQQVTVVEETEDRTYTVNPSGRTIGESEVTRPLIVRHIRKNVLVKELHTATEAVTPRGSWLAQHAPEEVVVVKKIRQPFARRTRSGDIIRVTPTQPKRIPMLKKNVDAHTVVELYAKPAEEKP